MLLSTTYIHYMVLKLQDIDKTLLGSIDVLVISLTIELVHKIMRGALAHLVVMCA